MTRVGETSSPALLQSLISISRKYESRSVRRSERFIRIAATELLIRLGYQKNEAKMLASKIIEQIQ